MICGLRSIDRISPSAILHQTVVFAQGMSLIRGQDLMPAHLEHEGAIEIGEKTYVGPYTVIHRARNRGHFTIIGSRVQIGALNNIGHHVKIGDGTVITQGVFLGGSVEIGELCYLSQNVSVLPHVKIAPMTFIGAGALVTKSIEEPRGLYYGTPAKRIRTWTGKWNRGEI